MNDQTESERNPYDAGEFVRITGGVFAGMTGVVYREIDGYLVVVMTSTGKRHAVLIDDVVRDHRGEARCADHR